MNNGYLEQVGTPEEVYNHPQTKFVADFIGESNIIEGYIEHMTRRFLKDLIIGHPLYGNRLFDYIVNLLFLRAHDYCFNPRSGGGPYHERPDCRDEQRLSGAGGDAGRSL